MKTLLTPKAMGILVTLLWMPTLAFSACSGSLGKVVVNEYNYISNYIELKVLDPTLTAGGANPFAGWKLAIWKRSGQNMVKATETDVSSNYTSSTTNTCRAGAAPTYTYVQLPFSSNDMTNDTIVVLWDSNGGKKLIDLFRLGTSALASYPASINNGYGNYEQCSTIEGALPSSVYDAPLVGTAGNKDIARLPDGTGPWTISPGQGSQSQQTLCGTNNALLNVTKTPSSATIGVGAGNPFTWTISASNTGTSGDMTNVSLSDTLPANMFLSACPTGASCTGTAGAYTAFTKAIGTLTPGTSSTLTATAYVTAAGSYTNTAAATATELAPGNSPGAGTVTASAIAGPQHVEFVHDGAALTCTAKAITVLGCTGSASCQGIAANQYVGSFAVTPGAISGAQWCSDALCASPITGSVTVSSGSVIYLREPTARTDTMAGSAASATNTTVQCTNTASGAFDAAAACNVVFASAGFLVSVPNHYACSAQTVTIQAVKSSSTATTCVPAFQGVSRNVSLYAGYTNPATGTQTASLNYVTSAAGATSALPALSTNAASPSTLSGLYFDNTGTATLSNFVYPDVGQLTLNPGYSGSAATGDSGLSLSAVSGNSFIAAPKSFSFSSITAAPIAAGANFSATVTALDNCGNATPNFGKESPTSEGVTLTHAKYQPTGSNASAGSLSASVGAFGNGAATATLSWSEVGTIDLAAVLTSTSYLGSGLSASGSTGSTGAVGRFIPEHFDTVVTQGCSTGAFTYSGQPLTVTVTARNLTGGKTQNYDGSASNPTPAFAKTVTLSDGNAGGAGAFSPSSFAPASFVQGVATLSPSYTFTARQTSPTSIKLRAIDSDNVSSLRVAPAVTTEGSSTIRSGRARLLNAYGSEKLDLPMTMRAEYWNGSNWVQNTLDNCSGDPALGAANAVSIALSSAITCVLDSGAPGASNAGCASAGAIAPINKRYREGTGMIFSPPLQVGDFNLWLGKPTAAGSLDVTAQVPVWLQYPWTGALGTNPVARASFGIYKSPLIYRRENY